MENLYKDSNMVKLVAAQAMGKRVDSKLAEVLDKEVVQ